MGTDFADSADRHWEDAEYLMAGARFPNADQLYGLSAECSLKAVMLGLGMPLSSTGAPVSREHKAHIDRLWLEFMTFANGRSGAQYVSDLAGVGNPFVDWQVDQRYHHRSDVSGAAVANHKQGAGMARRALANARKNGIVP